MRRDAIESLLLKRSRGAASRLRLTFYRSLGLKAGRENRMERVRCRRLDQIVLGDGNAFTEGCWLWPDDSDSILPRIVIGDRNYFNRDVMIDACGSITIGSGNLFGPGAYITDANHRFHEGQEPAGLGLDVGKVSIGNNCWIGAKAVILKNVVLGDNCVVAAGAVVTKSFARGSVVAGVPAREMRNHVARLETT